MLINILTNSIKFTASEKNINIHCYKDSDRVYLKIADEGEGMSEEELAQAILPFRQIDNSHTRKHEGTGLGLPISKKFIELHENAKFDMQSEKGILRLQFTRD